MRVMTKGRNTAAVSVESILEVAHAQQRSGLLSLETTQRGFLEEGELYLLAGQPTYARAGALVGLDAFHCLRSWRNIYFSFIPDAPRPPANILLPGRGVTNPLPAYSPALMPRSTDKLGPFSAVEPGATPPRVGSVGIEHRVPQKVEPERQVSSLILTRRQRLVYFLVDGQHTMADLARTTNKTLLEIELILSELQEQGLVIL